MSLVKRKTTQARRLMARSSTTFAPGNQVARKHGLRARSSIKVRHRRAGQLLAALQRHRNLKAEELPLARAWAEHEVLATDVWSLIQKQGLSGEDGEPSRWLSEYRAVRRSQTEIAKQLGLTPASARLIAGVQPDDPVSRLVALRQQMALEAADVG